MSFLNVSSHLSVSWNVGMNISLEGGDITSRRDSAEMIISVYNMSVLWSFGRRQQCCFRCQLIIYWEPPPHALPMHPPPSFVYTEVIRKHCQCLWRNGACINIFHMSLILKFWRHLLSLFLCLPHAWSAAHEVMRCFKEIPKTGHGPTPQTHWGRNAKTYEDKKNLFRLCKVCFLYWEIQAGLIISAT